MTRRASVSTDGQQTSQFSKCDGPAISGNGRYVVFESDSETLVPGDTNDTRDVFVHGPELTLQASAAVVSAGQPLELTAYEGPAGHASALAVTAIGGVPIFLLVLVKPFDADGHLVLDVTVPGGLAGLALTFQAFGDGVLGISATNSVQVTFQ